MKFSYEYTHERDVESAYILRLSNNKISQELSARCKYSCDKIGMPAKYWEAFDGTNKTDVIIPEHLKNQSHIHWLKVHKTDISSAQIAIILSHYSLWCRCIELDKPIVIFEHDAVMVKPFLKFGFYNMIQFLGCIEQVKGVLPTYKLPPHASWYEGRLRFICRAHAYAIDPQVAKNLVSHIIKVGIITTADVFMRSDLFGIIQDDVYAYDLAGETTNFEMQNSINS